MDIKNETDKTIYWIICRILSEYGFVLAENGDMVRKESGCCFSFDMLMSYQSVLDFQLDWEYA